MKRLALAFFLSLALVGCATTTLPPVSSPEYRMEDDERRIWTRSEEEEKDLNDSGLVYKDKELEDYLNAVARKLQPASVYKKVPFKIIVLKNPYSNAFAYPNGIIYVHTGILSRIDNEAQLATLLGHEMTHATHRHQVIGFRSLRNKAAVFASLRSTIGTLPAVGELTNVLGEIGTEAAITGHSRDQETEADMVGIGLMVKAGYDPDEAPKLFKHLKAEIEEDGEKEPFFFGSHPRLQDRIDNYDDFLKKLDRSRKGTINADIYRRKAASAILVNAGLDLKAGRFPSAKRGAERYVSIRPNDSRGYYILGEVFRQKGGADDVKEAKKYFKKATTLERPDADAFKGLGLLYFKEGNRAEAGKAFRTYMAMAPRASDRSYIEDYLRQCK